MSKTLILSDIHFCGSHSKVKSAEQLRPLWDGCDAMVLNGDTTEVNSPRHSEESKQRASELIAIATQDGVHTTYLCGNHDPVESDNDFMWFCKENVFVFHGHAAFETLAPWSWRAKFIGQVRKKYIQESGDGFQEQLKSARKASFDVVSGAFESSRPSAVFLALLGIPAAIRVLLGWKYFPSLISHWIEQYAPSAKFVIVGHTHHAGIWKRNGRVIINTGCFGFPSHPRAVVIDNDELIVYKLRLTDGHYSLGRVCSSWNVR